MAISIKHLQWITLLSFVCLCVRLTVCQAPPAQNNNQSANNECGVCKPKWIDTLDRHSGMLSSEIMAQVCNVAVGVFVNGCDNPYGSCNTIKTGTKRCCCPMENLSRVGECKALKKSKNACVPDKISSAWLVIFHHAYLQAAKKQNTIG